MVLISFHIKICLGYLFLALRTESFENDVVSAERKSVRILDLPAEIRDTLQIHVKDPAAFEALGMKVTVTPVVKMVRAARQRHADDLPVRHQLIEVPVYRSAAYGGVFRRNLRVYLIRCGVTLQLFHRGQRKRSLNRIAFYGTSPLCFCSSSLIRLYSNKE